MGRSYRHEREWGKRPQVKIKKHRKLRDQTPSPSNDQHTEDQLTEYEELEMEAIDEELNERNRHRG